MTKQIVSSVEKAAAITADPRWSSLISRDAKADGTFFYSVQSTGVYCRPSCASRVPNPENVLFYSTAVEAERAGFRPCKRCTPNELALAQQHAAKIAEACRTIEQSETEPSLAALAARAGMSSFHFHRLFRSITGLTPKRYAAAHRIKTVRQKLSASDTVTEAIYAAGYNSNGRFYANSNQALGMTPSAFRSGGRHTEIRFAVGESTLGSILVAHSGRGICAIFLGDDPGQLVRDLQDHFPNAVLIGGDEAFEQLVARVVGFVEQPSIGLDLPLDIRGTAFQQRVWQALRELPVGATASYSTIAERIGSPGSARAVAQACAHNNLAVAIPCHRVVRNDGSPSGYRWGVERKHILLERESRSVQEQGRSRRRTAL